jgi:formylglycine-generating enzyme required for sulfatase activity
MFAPGPLKAFAIYRLILQSQNSFATYRPVAEATLFGVCLWGQRRRIVKNSFGVAALAAVTGLSASIASAQVIIEFRTVGNAGNAGDPNAFGRGGVAYEYRIGAFEITNAQYAAFLNVVAASDPRGLFNASMGSDPRGGITRSGNDGSFTYAVKPNMGNKPVNYVSFFDAARMANWLTNGQGSGSTESGVYTLNANTLSAITRDLSNPNQIFLPTQDEFIKAGYHQPASQGGDTDNFWRFATRSNLSPFVAAATATGDIANPSATRVNYNSNSVWNGQNGNVTTVGSAGNTSFYGAFDMNGNVREWIETTAFSQGFRGQMGGDFTSGFNANPNLVFGLDPAFVNYAVPTSEGSTLGFRFASPVPPPGPTCDSIDFNTDGSSFDPQDINAFLSVFSEGPCIPQGATCNDIDFNNDGSLFDPCDIESFLLLFSEGPCSVCG